MSVSPKDAKDIPCTLSPAVSPGLSGMDNPSSSAGSDASDLGKVLEELKCAICLDIVMHRGFECSNSHLIHRICYFAMPSDTKTCPSCRVPMPKPDPATTVTRLARHLIKKCCYCQKRFDSEPPLAAHMEMCDGRLFVCPHAEMGDPGRGGGTRCSQIYSAAEMLPHMTKEHETATSEQRSGVPFRFHTLVPPAQQNDAAKPALRRLLTPMYNPPFLVSLTSRTAAGEDRKLWFVIDTMFKAGMFSLAVRHIGPTVHPAYTCRYAARMRVESGERTFSSIVPSIDTVRAQEVFTQGRCASALASNLMLEKRIRDPMQDGTGDYATSEIVIRVEERPLPLPQQTETPADPLQGFF